MSLTINQAQPTNYINNQLKNNKDKKFILNIDDKKLVKKKIKNYMKYIKKVIWLIQLIVLRNIKKSYRISSYNSARNSS